MLIGGPNQSYNVNFKELPLIEGKDFNQAVFEFGRQLFFKGISKNVQNDRTKNDFQKTSPPSESANCFSGEAEKQKSKRCDQAIFSNIFR